MALNDIIALRRKKLEEYKKQVSDPYPSAVERGMVLSEVLKKFSTLFRSKKKVSIVGRIFSWRDQGKIIFTDVADKTGRLQIVFSKEETKQFSVIGKTFDIGDFVEVKGRAYKTKKGHKSLLALSARLIAKSLRPIPTEWYGLEDVELKLRERHLDMLLNPEVREIFLKKALFWEEVRHFLQKEEFAELEMPIFESVPGGAEAEPFVTHLNALDMDLYLRISLELPLKKMLVGGYEKVFEIGRIFRNEGIDREHLQDYTQMECYWAYADYNDMMKMVEKLYRAVIKKVTGGLETKFGESVIRWGVKWPRVDYYTIFLKETGIDLGRASDDMLRKKAKELGLQFESKTGRGRVIDLIFKKSVRPKLQKPSFLVDPPVEIEPLAKRLVKDPGRVARFQIMAGGTELGKGFSELNDPLDQRKRFEEQMRLRESGDVEAQHLDEEYLIAMEYGMPPAAGFGVSERLFAVLMNRPVRETVVFPLMKDKSS